MHDKQINIDLKLCLFEENWQRYKELYPDFKEQIEKYINDCGAAVATIEETETIVGIETNFFTEKELDELF